MTVSPMLRQMRHDVWATEKLIEHCRSLSDAQLELTAPGTYGTIRRALEHIVAADTRYLGRLGTVVADPSFNEDHDMPLDDIAAMLAKVKAAVEGLFVGAPLDPVAHSRLRLMCPLHERAQAGELVPCFAHLDAKQVKAISDRVTRSLYEMILSSELDPDRVIRDTRRRDPADPPLLITSRVMLTQFVHHGSDHRAQIGTILGSRGLETPAIDVWAYGRAIGAIRERR